MLTIRPVSHGWLATLKTLQYTKYPQIAKRILKFYALELTQECSKIKDE